MSDTSSNSSVKSPGRNDPCPCGSGKKYKKCCMGKLVPEKASKQIPNVEALISDAISMFESGQIASARNMANEVLTITPNHPDANHILGLVEMESGNLGEAEVLLLKAEKKLQKNLYVQLNLAKLYERKKEYKTALSHVKKALKYDADFAEAHNSCGSILLKIGEAEKALSHFKQATKLEPTNLQYLLSYSAGLHHCDRIDEARQGYQEIINKYPEYVAPYINLAAIYRDEGNLEKAVILIQQAIKQEPNSAELLSNLGSLYGGLGKHDKEINWYKQALALNPGMLTTYSNLMDTLQELNRFEELNDYARKIMDTPELKPLLDRAAGAFGALAAMDELKSVIIRQIDATRNDDKANSHIGFLITNDLEYLNIETIYSLHRSWGKSFELDVIPFEHSKEQCNSSRIRLGYVSPDFRSHSVGLFIRNVLKYSDSKLFDIYCYSNCAIEDEITEEIKSKANVFKKINILSPKEVAEEVYRDKIDILVDLAGHTEKNRVAAFAYKPAPVQITYLGYPNTTGLQAIDYRITDHFADVVDGTKYIEKLVYMPESFLSFGSFDNEPIAEKFSYETSGFITFGSFNNIRKLNRATIELWSAVLHSIPRSQILLKSTGLDQKIVQDNVLSIFSDYGISRDKIVLFGKISGRSSHLAAYNKIDIALDTFPYNGTTTTCEALWMGVPVITLVGKKHAQRVSYSILKNIGVEDTIAYDQKQYLDLAARLAKDPVGLRELKVSLRDKLKKSILCDTSRFTLQLEKLYQKLWQDYCMK